MSRGRRVRELGRCLPQAEGVAYWEVFALRQVGMVCGRNTRRGVKNIGEICNQSRECWDGLSCLQQTVMVY